MKKYRIYYFLGAIVVLFILVWIFTKPETSDVQPIKTEVTSGNFQINVTTTGELEAKNSEKILGPSNLRNYRIWNMTIEDIIPDGTVVDSGQYVASLDRSELANRLKDVELDIDQLKNQLIKSTLDTSMTLRNARNELINLEYNLEELQIELEQSIYEPPATIRQIEINLDKAKRAFKQATSNYQLQYEKAKADMSEVQNEMTEKQNDLDDMTKVLGQFTISAPKPGMVIYRRGWDGKKQGVGSQISTWDPVVAELPDLTKMISKTYVNEIDISKVKVGQEVSIGVDAFPDKEYTGFVTEVANIGQQLRNSNAKVFEVIIEVNEYDSILRPAMTTKNKILTSALDSVLFVPLDCVHGNDSMSFVYKGKTKQQVIIGKSNENEIIIRAGLEKGESIYLIPPEKAEEYRIVQLDTAVINHFERMDAKKDKVAPKEVDPLDAMVKQMREGPAGQYIKDKTDEEVKEMIKKRQESGGGQMMGGKKPGGGGGKRQGGGGRK